MRLKNAELNIIISNSRLFASTETRGFCVLIWKPSPRLTGKADDDLCYWPRYSRSLKVFLILKSFRSKDLACIRTRRKVRAQKALQTWRTGVMLPQKIYNFTSLVWNFCRWGADVPPDETSLATRSKAKRLYSQARIIESYRWQRHIFFTLVAKLRENVHKCLTSLPSIFMTGVHPPSPHPKFPKWQRTETSLESRRRVANWVTFKLYKMKYHFNFSSS